MAVKVLPRSKFVLRGLHSLLPHNDSIEASDAVSAWRKDAANKDLSVPGDDRSPPWSWLATLYADDDGYLAVPSQNLMVCLRWAGAQIILKRSKTFKEVTQSGLLIESEYLKLTTHGHQVKLADVEQFRDLPFAVQAESIRQFGFRLWPKRAKVGQAKHIRVRSRWDEWQLEGEIQILSPVITFERLTELFDIAGRVGLCDWRPGGKTPGCFGMFESTLTQLNGAAKK